MKWKSIKWYEGIYEISEYGDIRSLDREEVQPDKVRNGYLVKSFVRFRNGKEITLSPSFSKDRLSVELNKNGAKRFFIHRLVYEAFVGDLIKDMIIHHRDSDKTNNHYTNLEQMDYVQHNNIHSHTAWNKGIKNPRQMVENARKARARSHVIRCKKAYELRMLGKTYKEIGEDLGICRESASLQVKRFLKARGIENAKNI